MAFGCLCLQLKHKTSERRKLWKPWLAGSANASNCSKGKIRLWLSMIRQSGKKVNTTQDIFACFVIKANRNWRPMLEISGVQGILFWHSHYVCHVKLIPLDGATFTPKGQLSHHSKERHIFLDLCKMSNTICLCLRLVESTGHRSQVSVLHYEKLHW